MAGQAGLKTAWGWKSSASGWARPSPRGTTPDGTECMGSPTSGTHVPIGKTTPTQSHAIAVEQIYDTSWW